MHTHSSHTSKDPQQSFIDVQKRNSSNRRSIDNRSDDLVQLQQLAYTSTRNTGIAQLQEMAQSRPTKSDFHTPQKPVIQGFFFDTFKEGIFKNLYKSDLKETKPFFSSLYGFLPGKSHHKRMINTLYSNLGGLSKNHFKGKWGNKEKNLNASIKKHHSNPVIDAKVRNDVYVANILRDQELLREAVAFGLLMCDQYGEGGTRSGQISNSSGGMDHTWPDQDLSGSKNTDYRGWFSVTGSLLAHYTPETSRGMRELTTGIGEDYLSNAIEANRAQLRRLSTLDRSFTQEESMYILRVMGQLRDVMKAEKSRGGLIPTFLQNNEDTFNRIKVRGVATEEGRDVPTEHASSRSFPHRFFQPLGTYAHQSDQIYQVQDQTEDNLEPERFDYLQGTSGTTLDMVNFFLAHGKSKDETAKLMQVFYANWHAIAPDGNAHSQSESIGTMMQYLYRSNLKKPIMSPIKSQDDVREMQHSGYANALGEGEGYLYRQ